LEIYPRFTDALDGITVNTEVVVLTWLHLARREVLKVHPRRETHRPLCGVFATRSPDRPNPIGLHRTRVVEIDKQRGLRVDALEALDGTPVIDIKPILPESPDM
jgi:tRNA-Thr(GGU) m(6)t(6)A37 methyltransferase TsaA